MQNLGTILYLKNGTKKVMIIGRGLIIPVKEEKEFFDYSGVLYPEGINPQEMIYFNESDIDTIISEGYEDEEELRFRKIYEENIEEIKINNNVK